MSSFLVCQMLANFIGLSKDPLLVSLIFPIALLRSASLDLLLLGGPLPSASFGWVVPLPSGPCRCERGRPTGCLPSSLP